MKQPSAAKQLAAFLAKYSPEVADEARKAIARLRRRVPGAHVLVYDNYNALAVGFSPTERASDTICSIAVFPRWVSLFLMRGADLPDPERRLRGGGKIARHVVLDSAGTLEEPAIATLLKGAIARAEPALRQASGRLIIKSVSVKQRPRRPAGPRGSAGRKPRGSRSRTA
jgi:hypothetical protein